MFVQSDDIFNDETVGFVDDFAKEQLDEYDGRAAHRVEHRHHRELPHGDPGRRRRRRRTGEEVEAAFDVAPGGHPDVHRQRRRRARSTSSSAPAPATSRSGPWSSARSATPSTRPTGVTRHPVGPRRGRRRPARQPRGEPDPPHLPGDPVRVPLPRRAAAQHRAVAAVDGAGADRGRARRRWWPTRSTSSSAR